MESREKLIEEIRQIKMQYRAEVNGVRKQWPRAIKTRVMQLTDMGLKARKIAELTGVSYHTVAAWKAQHSKQNNFHQLPVVVEPATKTSSKNLATVTDAKKSKTLETGNKSVTVTVTTPDGFVIQVGSPEAAAKIIFQLRKE